MITAKGGKPGLRGAAVTFASIDARTRGLDPTSRDKLNQKQKQQLQQKEQDKLLKGGRLPGTKRIKGKDVAKQRFGLGRWLVSESPGEVGRTATGSRHFKVG